MTRARRDPPDDSTVHDSCGNVFADMGMPDAEARLARAELARARRAEPPGAPRNAAPLGPPPESPQGVRPSHPHPADSRMSPAMQDAIGRLQALPPDVQEAIAPRLHDYLTRLEELRTLIQEGVDSGPDEPLDMEAIKRDAWSHAGPRADPPPDRP